MLTFLYCTDSRTNKDRFLGFIEGCDTPCRITNENGTFRIAFDCDEDTYWECRNFVESIPNHYMCF